MDAKIDNILSFADIGDFVYQPVKTYSSGMYVRLAFSIYANIDPEIFIVDEALAVGDTFFIHRCMLRFHEMQKQGKTILFVSHSADSIKRLCQRTLWIDQGAVMMQGDSSKVVDHYLAFLFKRPLVEEGPRSDPEVTADNPCKQTEELPGNQEYKFPPENTIPNIDRRLGNQDCTIVGVALYNESMEPVFVCPNDSHVILRMTIQNNTISKDFPLVVGYIVRDHKGIEIASSNSEMEKVSIPLCPIGETITVRQKIFLPILYPGKYSFTPTIGYIGSNENIILGDRIDNAIVFELTSEYKMHITMRFKTEIEIEEK
jgi:ABC-type glutathione transport system ATPase component